MHNPLSLRHFLLALAVVFVWGTNFVVIKVALIHLPPILLAALRFTLVLLPAMFFLPRPAVPWHNLARYGIFIGVGQFGLLYLAMNGHISPGIASLVIQTQVFFTIGLSMWLGGERPRPYQWLSLLCASSGIALIFTHVSGAITGLGLALVLLAALSWAGGNITARACPSAQMLAYVVWSSAWAIPPLFALSFIMEGWHADLAGMQQATWQSWLAVVWQAWGNSLFGYVAWGWLLAKHPATTVVPMALLVPVFGMGASALLLGESFPAWKLIAAFCVMAGLAGNILWPHLIVWAKTRY
ncbi:EamA family transporter [Uliginosibacterium gangwonense]|uniref:EamA family transporter n=1 Tax=Uliginosibacterium gangwonense TaxID=392736 RepID=UPI00038056EF|nr:EamA family transporter [Uliginosibacterium gangwonense]